MDRARVEALFDQALDLPEEAREGWLELLPDDESVVREVRALLSASARAGILEKRPAHQASDLPFPEARPLPPPPERLGPYRIVREIGQGGMASVYLAERDDGEFEQRVAVKVLRTPWDGAELASRLLAERQILASLRHPNIARLLDGGVTPDGRPYLVMEYVAGLPIDRFCDRSRLDVDERVRLVATLARAVHHAHRSLVVHRDIKPSNVLVVPNGEPRLLDFGIAKILDPAAVPFSSETPVTRTGSRPMTPEYASPEQIREETITTATDVYALGVLLYELLSGRRPFARSGRSPAEVERAVLEEEPVRPSAAASRSWAAMGDRRGPGREELADARRTTPERLRRRLEGDLDNIVLMALRKEPDRRYSSALQLAEDLERHLEGSPVQARATSTRYRLGKFVARHRVPVMAAIAFVIVLGGYAGTVTVQERRVRAALEEATLEAEKAERVTRFLMELFEGAGAAPGAPGGTASAEELLERGLTRAEALSGQPAAQAQMLDVVGRIYRYLGQYDRGRPVLERALDLRRGAFGPEHPEVAESVRHLADLLWSAGRLESAEALWQEALAMERRIHGEEHPDVAEALNGLHLVLRDRGDYSAAEPLAREALAMRRALLGDDHPATAESVNYMGALLRRMARWDEAETHYRDALETRRRILGEDHPDVAESLNNLAVHMAQTDRLDAAEPFYRAALAGYRRAFGPRHPFVATTMNNLGLLLLRTGDVGQGEELLRGALEMRRELLGEDHPDVGVGTANLAGALRRQGRLEEAVGLYREAVALLRRVHRGPNPSLANALDGLARSYRLRGETELARRWMLEAVYIRESLLGPDHPSTTASLLELGRIHGDRGDPESAEEALLDVLERRRRSLGDAHEDTRSAAGELVLLYEGWGRSAAAERWRALAGDAVVGRTEELGQEG